MNQDSKQVKSYDNREFMKRILPRSRIFIHYWLWKSRAAYKIEV